MFRRNKKTRKYHAPSARVTQMALENNFCATVRFKIQVDEWENMNDPTNPLEGRGDAAEEGFYFES